MSEWMDIASAPKDGTIVLIAKSGEWTYAAYCGLAQRACPAGSDEKYPWVILDSTNGTNATMEGGKYGTTHWQPLPAPPDTRKE